MPDNLNQILKNIPDIPEDQLSRTFTAIKVVIISTMILFLVFIVIGQANSHPNDYLLPGGIVYTAIGFFLVAPIGCVTTIVLTIRYAVLKQKLMKAKKPTRKSR